MNYLMLAALFISFASFAQDTNKVIIDQDSNEPILIGHCTREAFKDTNFSDWFNSGYKDYNVDSSALAELDGRLKDVRITIITGTWCSDSRVELPAFFKIIDYLQYPEEKLIMIAVNEDKEIPGSDILDKYNLELVPSFIFYRNDSEIGRIQELPEETLEKDMVRIVTGQD